jgi:cell division protein FtsB
MEINRIKTISEKLKKLPSLFLVMLLIALSLSLYRSISRTGTANLGIEEAQNRVDKLREENKKLDEKLKEVRNIEFVEKQLRDKLGLAKEGEIVIILPEEEILRKLAPIIEEEEEVLPDPNWVKWAKLFDF